MLCCVVLFGFVFGVPFGCNGYFVLCCILLYFIVWCWGRLSCVVLFVCFVLCCIICGSFGSCFLVVLCSVVCCVVLDSIVVDCVVL